MPVRGLGHFSYFVKNLKVMKEPRRSPHSGVAGVRGVTGVTPRDAAAAARASTWRESGTTQPTTAGAQRRALQRTVRGAWRQWLSGATLLVAASASNAALLDRGGGLLYDTVLDVTWLQDANYAYTQGIQGQGLGRMTWPDAMAWVEQLVYQDTVRNLTLSNWRLPSIAPLDGVRFRFATSIGGDTDDGYNISAPGTPYAGSTASELAYMYYNNLGNIARCPITGWDDCLTTPGDLKPGPFINLFEAAYWFNSNQSLPFAPPDAWGFDMGGHQYGAQGGFNGNTGAFAWAVMDGDVALVPGGGGPPGLIPEPGTIALLGLGMLGLGSVARRSKS